MKANFQTRHYWINRLKDYVAEYYELFGRPVHLKIISGKFSRALQRFPGGYQGVIEELCFEASIHLINTSDGRTYAAPPSCTMTSQEVFRKVREANCA